MDSVDRDQLFSFTAPKPALGTGLDVLTLTTCAYCHPDNKVIEMEGDGEGRTGGGKKYDWVGGTENLREGRILHAPFAPQSNHLRPNPIKPHALLRESQTFVLTFFFLLHSSLFYFWFPGGTGTKRTGLQKEVCFSCSLAWLEAEDAINLTREFVLI